MYNFARRVQRLREPKLGSLNMRKMWAVRAFLLSGTSEIGLLYPGLAAVERRMAKTALAKEKLKSKGAW
jgi:hypothetical protein